MKSQLVFRWSDCDLVSSVSEWNVGFESDGLVFPDGNWDLVFYRHGQEVGTFITGQSTKATKLPFVSGDQVLAISFKAGTYLPNLPASYLVNNVARLKSRGTRFELGTVALEIPRFDNAEDLVRRLIGQGLLRSDSLVSGVLAGHALSVSTRSFQRHFTRATGLSPHHYQLILRAKKTVGLLQEGHAASRVAAMADYADQAHMCRSLKAITGLTPGEIQAGDLRMSFLFNTRIPDSSIVHPKQRGREGTFLLKGEDDGVFDHGSQR